MWAIIDQHSLNLVQSWLKQNAAWAWDPYLQRIFDLPAWVVIGIVPSSCRPRMVDFSRARNQ